MNCDAKQGCFFKKSVCNSGCKSKLPVEIAKVSTARLTFSSPLARLAEAVPPFLFFFLFLLRLQLFFLIKPLGVIFRSKKWCWDIQIFPWTIYFLSIAPYNSYIVQRYDEIQAFYRSFNQWQQGWPLHCAAITIGWNIWRWLIFRHTVVRLYDSSMEGN